MTDRTHDADEFRYIIEYCDRKMRQTRDALGTFVTELGTALYIGRIEAYEDVLQAAGGLPKDSGAKDNRQVDEFEAADIMAGALAVRHGQTQLKSRKHYQSDAETALQALLTHYDLVRKA